MASEYLKWKYRDVKPREKVVLTKKQRRQNWWHYNKWFVILGIALVIFAGYWIWRVVTEVHPDYQVAYVGSVSLSEEQTVELENYFAALGADCDGDGEVTVQINEYLTDQSSSDIMYSYAYSVRLMVDFEDCESYFFILEDPETFQENYEILREDWIPLRDGFFLARRIFGEDKTVKYPEECDALWDELTKEAAP